MAQCSPRSSSTARPTMLSALLPCASWLAFGAVLALSLGPQTARAQAVPDTVTTVFTSDTLVGFGAVGGVTVDALGYVYIADFQNSVWRITPQGEVDRFADGLYGASGNAVGPRGWLYQSSFNGNALMRISRTGEASGSEAQALSSLRPLPATPR